MSRLGTRPARIDRFRSRLAALVATTGVFTSMLVSGGAPAAYAATVGTGNCVMTATGTVTELTSSVGSDGKTSCSFQFTSHGSFQVPVGVTSLNTVVIGGGGGGGSGRGGGGGGGGVAVQSGVAATAGETFSVIVASGGAGASTANTAGADGQDSWLARGSNAGSDTRIAQAGGGGGGGGWGQDGRNSTNPADGGVTILYAASGGGGGAGSNFGSTNSHVGGSSTASTNTGTTKVTGGKGGDNAGTIDIPRNTGGGGGASGSGVNGATDYPNSYYPWAAVPSGGAGRSVAGIAGYSSMAGGGGGGAAAISGGASECVYHSAGRGSGVDGGASGEEQALSCSSYSGAWTSSFGQLYAGYTSKSITTPAAGLGGGGGGGYSTTGGAGAAGSVFISFTLIKTVTVTAQAQTLTFTGQPAAGSPSSTLSGQQAGETLSSVSYNYYASNYNGGVTTTTRPTGVGTYTVTPFAANLSANTGSYNYSYVSSTLTITQATPTFGTFTDMSRNGGDADFTVTNPTVNPVTGGTDVPAGTWSYASSSPSVATISTTGMVHLVSSGTTTITATFTITGSSTNWYTSSGMASPASTLTVSKTTPTFGSWSNVTKYMGDADFAPSAPAQTTSNGNTAGSWSYSSSNTSVATVVSNSTMVHLVANGTSTITATFTPANTSLYSTPTSSTFTVTVNKQDGTFSAWNSGGIAKTFGDVNFSLVDPTQTTSIPGTWSYASGSTAVATIVGTHDVHIVGAGSSTITATFIPTDTATYNTYTVNATLTVAKATLTFSFPAVSMTVGDSDLAIVTPTITALPNGTVPSGTWSYSSGTTSVATIVGGSYHVLIGGTSTVTATFTPTDTTSVNGGTATMTLSVSKATPVFSGSPLFSNVNKTYGDAAFAPTAPTQTTSIAGSWSYASSNTAVISGTTTLTVAGAGNATITATFTPTDTTKYSVVTTSFTVTVATGSSGVAIDPGNTASTGKVGVTQALRATFASGASGTLTFYDNGTAIPGCTNLTTSTTAVLCAGSWNPSTAGTHLITATLVPSSGNFATATSASYTITIALGTPAVLSGTFSPTTGRWGDSPATITPKVMSVPGTWSYVSNNTATIRIVNGNQIQFVQNGSTSVTATYTPTDTTNYGTYSENFAVGVYGSFVTVNVTNSSGGTVYVNGVAQSTTVVYSFGVDLAITFSLNTGQKISALSIDNRVYTASEITSAVSSGLTLSTGTTTPHVIDVTFSAASFVLSWDARCGGSVQSTTYAYGSTTSVPAAPTCSGKTFYGWYTNSTFTGGAWYTARSMPANDVTIYAAWIQNASTSGFGYQASNAAAGTGTMAGNVYVTAGQTLTLSSTEPTTAADVGSIQYQLFKSTDSGSTYTQVGATQSTSSFSIGALAYDTHTYYQIRTYWTYTSSLGTVTSPTTYATIFLAMSPALVVTTGPSSSLTYTTTDTISSLLLVSATGGGGGMPAYNLQSGTLPPGTSLSVTSGYMWLNGVPTTPGTYQFTVRYTDTNGAYGDSSQITIYVNKGTPNFSIATGLTSADFIYKGGGTSGYVVNFVPTLYNSPGTGAVTFALGGLSTFGAGCSVSGSYATSITVRANKSNAYCYVIYTQAADTRYNSATFTDIYVFTAATLTYVPANRTKTYGSSGTSVTPGTLSGFVGTDVAGQGYEPTVSCSATGYTTTTPVGTVLNNSCSAIATDFYKVATITNAGTTTVVAAAITTPTPTVAATTGSVRSINVSWTAPLGAVSYTVRLYDSAGTTLLASISNIATTSYRITTSDYAGLAEATYKVSLQALGDGLNYSDGAESTKVSVTTLPLPIQPTITAQPTATVSKDAGQSYSVSVTANAGNGTLSYQWYKDGNAISGATSATYSALTSLATTDAGSYTVDVTNTLNGTTSIRTSSASVLTVYAAPTITTPSTGLSGTYNSAYSLSLVSANGSGGNFWTIVAGSLIGGLSLDSSTGVISGTPTAVGNRTVTVRVTDSNGVAATTSSFTISIAKANQTITSWAVPANRNINAGAFTSAFTLNSGLTGFVDSNTLSVCTTSGFTVTLIGVGLCRIYAVESSGNAYYNAMGASASMQFNVTAITTTFNSNYGTATTSTQTISTPGNVAITTNSFVRTGYNFAGWNTAANGSGTSYTDGQSVTFTANTTLYAQWSVNASNLTSPVPTALATTGSIRSITVTWAAVTGTVSYTVRLYDSTGGTLLATIANLTGTSRVITAADYAAISEATYLVSVQALGDGTFYLDGTESTKVSVTTLPLPVQPTIDTQPTATVSKDVGQAYSVSVAASTTDGGTLSYQWYKGGALIVGATNATFNSITNPVLADAGSYAVVVTNTLNGTTSTRTSNASVLTVYSLPSIDPVTTTARLTGTAFSIQLTVTSGSGGNTFTLISGLFPTGVSMSSTGLISGTATVVGTFTVTVRATDSNNGSSVDKTFSIVVSKGTLATPTGLAASSNAAALKSFTAVWNAVANAYNYQLQVNLKTGGMVCQVSTAAGVTSQIIDSSNCSGLANYTDYYVYVKALPDASNNFNAGNFSASISYQSARRSAGTATLDFYNDVSPTTISTSKVTLTLRVTDFVYKSVGSGLTVEVRFYYNGTYIPNSLSTIYYDPSVDMVNGAWMTPQSITARYTTSAGTVGSSGSYSATVTYIAFGDTNLDNTTAALTKSMVVNGPLSGVGPTSNNTAMTGVYWSWDLRVAGGNTANYTLSPNPSWYWVPSWMTFDTVSARLYGTPDTSGIVPTWSVRVSDGSASIDIPISLTVIAGVQPNLTVSPSPAASYFNGTGYSQSTTFTFGNRLVPNSGSTVLTGNAFSFTIDQRSTAPGCSIPGQGTLTMTVTATGPGVCWIGVQDRPTTNYAATWAFTAVTFLPLTLSTRPAPTLTIRNGTSLAVTFSTDARATSYVVRVFSDAGGTAQVSGDWRGFTPAGPNYVTGLTAGTTYYVGVVAVGTGNYSDSTISTLSSLAPALALQSIAFATLSSRAYGSADVTLNATASSGLPVTYSTSSSALICVVLGNTVTIRGTGSCDIRASQSGNADYSAATDVVQTLTITPKNLTVTATVTPNSGPYGTAAPTVSFSNSGLVTGETIDSVTITWTGPGGYNANAPPGATDPVGTYTGTPSAAVFGTGDSRNYNITYVNASYTISHLLLATPVVTTTATREASGTNVLHIFVPYVVNAVGYLVQIYNAATGGIVVGSVDVRPQSPVSGREVTWDGQTANTTYYYTVTALADGVIYSDSAESIRVSATTGKLLSTITFATLQTRSYGDANFSVSATNTAGTAISFTSVTIGTCSVLNGVVTITAAGTCTVRASDVGTATYEYSPTVDQSFTVNKANLTVYATVSTRTNTYPGNTVTTGVVVSGLVRSDAYVSSTISFIDSSNTSSTTAPTQFGSYTVRPSNVSLNAGALVNYNVTYVDETYQILRGISSVTARSPGASVSYGVAVTLAARSNLSGTITFSVGGTAVCSSVAATATADATCSWTPSTVGSTTYSVQFTPTDANYDVATDSLTVSISNRILTIIGITVVDRMYIPNNTAVSVVGLPQLVGVLPGDSVSIVLPGYFNVDTPFVGNNKPVTVSYYTITGPDAAKYTLQMPTNLTGNIIKAQTGTSISVGATRTYGQLVTLSSRGDGIRAGSVDFRVDGVTVCAGVSVTGLDTAYCMWNPTAAGSHTFENTFTPTDVNYASSDGIAYASVAKATVTITGVTGDSRVYNGTVSATVRGTATLSGIVGTDDVRLSGTPTTVFSDANIGLNKQLTTTGYSLAGTQASNYNLVVPNLYADITAALSQSTLSVRTATPTYGTAVTFEVSASEYGLTSVFIDGTAVCMALSMTGDIRTCVWNPTTAGSHTIEARFTPTNNNISGDVRTITLSVAKLVITVNGMTGVDKVYDGSNTAVISGTASIASQLVNGDSITLTGTPSASFANANVGTGKAITVTGYGLSDSTNYLLVEPTGLTASITQAASSAVASLTAGTPTYGTTVTTRATGSRAGTFEFKVDGTVVCASVATNGSFVATCDWNPTAAGNHTLDVRFTPTDNNYAVSTDAYGFSVAKKALTISGLSGVNKVYDGNTASTLSGTAALAGLVNGDSISLTGTPSASFADANIGNGKAITVTGYGLSSGANYTLSQPTGLTANITAAATTSVVVVVTASPTYGATVTVRATVSQAGTVEFKLDGTLVCAAVTTDGSLQANCDWNPTGAGAHTVDVRLAPTSSNFAASTDTLAFSVAKKALTITGLSGVNRVYDGGANATLSGTAALVGLANGDSISIAGTPSASFADANVGTGKTITVTGYTLSSSANYTLSQPAGLTANITKAASTATVVNATSNLTYGGAVALRATLSGAGIVEYTIDGVVAPCGTQTVDVHLETVCQWFPDRAGDHTVDIRFIPASGNYTTVTDTLGFAVAKKVITVIGLTGVDKFYDGNTTATLTGLADVSGQMENNDTVTLNGTWTATFANSTAGNGKAITVTGYSISGSFASNYILAQPTGLTANIISAATTASVAVVTASPTYGSTVTLQATVSQAGTVEFKLDGVVICGAATVDGAMQATCAWNPSSSGVHTVDVRLTPSSGNYAASTGTLGFTVAKKSVSIIGLSGVNKIYDGTTAATIAGTPLISGLANGDNITVTGTGTASFLDANIGNGKPLTITGYGLSSTANYTLTQPTGVTANITATSSTSAVAVVTVTPTYGSTVTVRATVSNAGTVEFKLDGIVVCAAVATDGSLQASCDWNPTSAGSHTVDVRLSPSSSNFTTSTATLGFSVAKKVLTVSGLTGVDKVYDGTTTGAVTGTATPVGLANGDSISITGSPTVSFANANVGTGKTLTVSGYTLSNGANYSLTQPTGLTASITAAGTTITAPAISGAVYGTDVVFSITASQSGTISVTVDGNSVCTSLAATVATALTCTWTPDHAGSHTAVVTFTPTSSNYTGSSATINFSVATKAITVTATVTPVSQAYGSNAPVKNFTVSGMVHLDVIGSVTYTFSGTNSSTAPSAVGSYSLTPSAAFFSNGRASDYNITYVAASYTVVSGTATATISTSAGTSAIYNSPVVITVTVSQPGTVTVRVDGVAICSNLTSSNGAVTCNWTPAAATTSVITAELTPTDVGYAVATATALNVTVGRASQTITLSPTTTKTWGDAPFAVSATSTSGLTVTIASGTPSLCTYSGGIVTILHIGTCVITASQAGDSNYLAATNILRSISVNAIQLVWSQAPSVTVSAGVRKQIHVAWNLDSNAAGYLVRVYDSSNNLLGTVGAVTGNSVDIRTANFASIGDNVTYFISVQKQATVNAIDSAQSATISARTNFYATISYLANSATSGAVPAASSYTEGATAAAIAANSGNLARTGYTFAGWNTAAAGTGTDYAANGTTTYSSVGDLVLYAKWTANALNVSFSTNYGTPSVITQGYTAGVSQSLRANTYTRAGYLFSGWATTATGPVVYADAASVTTVVNIDLYAVWTAINYNVNYLLNGGVGITPTQDTRIIGQTFSVRGIGSVARTGYDFGGWSDGTTIYQPGTIYTVADSDVNLTAVWTLQHYAITYDVNGATGTASRTSDDFIYGSSAISLPSVGSMVKAGYTFAGWSQTPSGTAIAGLFSTGASVTLYAVWQANTYTITYNANGATGAPARATDTYTTGTTGISLSGIGSMQRLGYTYGGWSTSPTGLALGNIAYTTLTDVTLYANWSPIPYSVSYDLRGGTSAVPTEGYHIIGDRFNLAAAPTLSGFHFAGWSDGSSTYQAGYSYLVGASNIMLRAVWVQIFYVHYNFNGSADPAPADDPQLDQTVVAALTAPTRVGYTFAGWRDQSGALISAGSNFTVGATHFILSAQWAAISRTVTYVNSAGPVPTEANHIFGDNFSVASIQSRVGYTFSGWTDGTQVYGIGATYTVGDSNVILTAVWVANWYPIIYDMNLGTSQPYSNQTYQYGTIFVIPGAALRHGYTFVGWHDGTQLRAPGSAMNMTAGPLTLTATWSIVSNAISYDLGGAPGTAPTESARTIGQTFTLAGEPVWMNHDFLGWSDGTTIYVAGTTYTNLGDPVTLTARWANSAALLQFLAGGATGTAPGIMNSTVGSSVVLPGVGGLSYAGYNFAGWNDGTTTYAAGASYSVTGTAFTFTAVWTAIPAPPAPAPSNNNSTPPQPTTVTVQFNLGGAAGSAPTKVTGAVGSWIILPAAVTSTAGVKFAGWTDGTKTYAAGASYQLFDGAGGMTALWTVLPVITTQNAVTVTYGQPTQQLVASSSAGSPLQWTTSSPVCRISASGEVTALAAGDCEVQVVDTVNQITKTVLVKVAPRLDLAFAGVTNLTSTSATLAATVQWPGADYSVKFCVTTAIDSNNCVATSTISVNNQGSGGVSTEGPLTLARDVTGLKANTVYFVRAAVITGGSSYLTTTVQLVTPGGKPLYRQLQTSRKTLVDWQSLGITGMLRVVLDGKVVGTTDAKSFVIPALVGPKQSVQLQFVATANVVMLPIDVSYLATTKPIPYTQFAYNNGQTKPSAAATARLIKYMRSLYALGFTKFYVGSKNTKVSGNIMQIRRTKYLYRLAKRAFAGTDVKIIMAKRGRHVRASIANGEVRAKMRNQILGIY